MLPNNPPVSETGASFYWSYFKYTPYLLSFIPISCSHFQQMVGFKGENKQNKTKERSLSSTNLLNIPESIPVFFSFVSFLYQRPQKLQSLCLCLQTPNLISYHPSFCILLSSYTQPSSSGHLWVCFGFPHPSPSCDEPFTLEASDLVSNLNSRI